MSRFGKNIAQTSSEKDSGPLTHDMLLVEMFGEDAQSNSSASKKDLCLDKAQVDILNNSWRCQFPDKLSAYRETNNLFLSVKVPRRLYKCQVWMNFLKDFS